MVRRYFHKAMNEMRYNKNREINMGGQEYRILTPEEINGYVTRDAVQESIDSLTAAIDRLDNLIHEWVKVCPCKDKK
jgi:hypothetical protein